MSKVFNLSNVFGKLPQFDITVRKLSQILRPGITLMDNPLVISSRYDSMDIDYQAPYFMEKVVDFKEKFQEAIQKHNGIICFFVIMNYFPPIEKNKNIPVQSHGMVCVYKPREVTLIFDPNGNFEYKESVYSSQAFNSIPKYGNVVNPLYRVVDQYIKNELKQKDVAIFSNGYIPCPLIPNSCMYRSAMFVFAFKRTNDIGRATNIAYEYSTDNDTAMHAKTIIELVNRGDVRGAREMFDLRF